MKLRGKKRTNWISEDTLRMVRLKRRAFRIMKRMRKTADFRRYRILSNKVRNLMRLDHQHHPEQISYQLYSNQKMFWRWLKNTRGSISRVPVLQYMGSKLSSVPDKVKAFNTYFQSVYDREETHSLPAYKNSLRTTGAWRVSVT